MTVIWIACINGCATECADSTHSVHHVCSSCVFTYLLPVRLDHYVHRKLLKEAFYCEACAQQDHPHQILQSRPSFNYWIYA